MYWGNDSNTWTALAAASSTADGTAGYAPKPLTGQQTYILTGNASWTDPNSISVG